MSKGWKSGGAIETGLIQSSGILTMKSSTGVSLQGPLTTATTESGSGIAELDIATSDASDAWLYAYNSNNPNFGLKIGVDGATGNVVISQEDNLPLGIWANGSEWLRINPTGENQILGGAGYAVLAMTNDGVGNTVGVDGLLVEYDSGGGFNLSNLEGGVVNLNTGSSSLGIDDLNSYIALTTGLVRVIGGDLTIETAGKGLKIAEGANAKMGVATLVAGTVTVNTTAISAGSRVFLSRNGGSGTWGNLDADPANFVAGTSFQIDSDNAADTSDVAWMIVDPA